MKRFVWRLQRVLDVKTKEEKMRKSELIAVTEPRRRLAEQEFFIKHSVTTDGKIKEVERRIAGLELEREAKTAKLIEVRQFREGLDRLRAEAKAKFVEEREKAEQKELDEIATVRFARAHGT